MMASLQVAVEGVVKEEMVMKEAMTIKRLARGAQTAFSVDPCSR
jgi:hypothetical protein